MKFMNDLERKFLISVERGDITTLKYLLTLKDNQLDINCCDPLARNALIIAINSENLEIFKLLLDAKINIGDALLYAIDENNVEIVEMLLNYEVANYKQGQYVPSWQQEREDSFFSADITPLILAAHKNNFEIVKLLLDRRICPIPDPHPPRCECVQCCRARADDCLRHSRARINAYRALASPCLMALSTPDPLLVAFEMSAKLENLAQLEPEYKQDFLILRTQCQKFATSLLDYTQTSKELETLLNYSDECIECTHGYGLPTATASTDRYMSSSYFDSETETHDTLLEMSAITRLSNFKTRQHEHSSQSSGGGGANNTFTTPRAPSLEDSPQTRDVSYTDKWKDKKDSIFSLDSVTDRRESYGSSMRLARLRLAIQCKQKTFCAHPNIQELLAKMWYDTLPGFRRKNLLAQSLQIICIGIMFPIYSIAYLINPHSQLGRYIRKPFIKFICHSASYITFLILLILASQRIEAFYNWPTLIRLFIGTEQHDFFDAQANLTILKQFRGQTPQPPPTNRFDDSEINQLAAFYKLRSSSGVANVSPSSARGLDDLVRVFEELPASSKKRGTLPAPIEFVILIWVVSLIWDEIKQIRMLGLNYYKDDMWNILDSIASGLYVGTIVLRIISCIQTDAASMEVAREHWHAYDPALLSEGLFAAATIFSALRLVYIFSMNPYLGPLQISLGRMAVDIIRFSWIYILVLFAFACGMNQLLWYYADLERHQCLNVTNYNLAQYYSTQTPLTNQDAMAAVNQHHANETLLGTVSAANKTTAAINSTSAGGAVTTTPTSFVNELSNNNLTDDKIMESAFIASLEDNSSKPPITIDDSCKTWRHFSNVFESVQTLFWANFGLVDLENFDLTGMRQYTRFWALLMFGSYCFINVIVVLNLLIAMMNHSYVKISKRSDIEWKFARTRLWMSYFDAGSTVPVPFNIIPSIKSIKRLAKRALRVHKRAARATIAPAGKCVCGLVASQCKCKLAAQCETAAAAAAKPPSRATQLARHRDCTLTLNYKQVIRNLVRRYLVHHARTLEKKRELTEAKLDRWAKMGGGNLFLSRTKSL